MLGRTRPGFDRAAGRTLGWLSITNAIGIAGALSSMIGTMRPPGSEGDASAEATAGRMTREQSRAHTRERVLTAARSVFANRGFHGASVEEIASEAGFSTGALYSNFDGKEDLFLVLMEREIEEHAREIEEAVRSSTTVAERAAGGARVWMKMIER